jgi:hypothetical protein
VVSWSGLNIAEFVKLSQIKGKIILLALLLGLAPCYKPVNPLPLHLSCFTFCDALAKTTPARLLPMLSASWQRRQMLQRASGCCWASGAYTPY